MSNHLVKALYAFYKELFLAECAHSHIQGDRQSGSFCADCGYAVNVVWQMLRCRTCGGKRHPKQEPDGSIRPLHKYCQHCGSAETRLVKRPKIHAHEIPYAVCVKEIDFSEPNPFGQPAPSVASTPFGPGHASQPKARRYAANPFENTRAGKIVEGEVLKRVEITRPIERSR